MDAPQRAAPDSLPPSPWSTRDLGAGLGLLLLGFATVILVITVVMTLFRWRASPDDFAPWPDYAGKSDADLPVKEPTS